uniref:Nucleolar pre-ribosomal-associated protein 1 n=2 Tax=Bursaphelenchus xylophilus TaxID=6326 RepID=A0A1I7RSQ1_BURXY
METGEILQERIDNLFELLGPEESEVYYHSPSPSFLDKDIQSLIDLTEKSFLQVPSLREAVLELVKAMVHECTRYTLIQKTPSLEQKRLQMSEGLCNLFSHLNAHVQNMESDDLRFLLLSWILTVCSELSKNYTESMNKKVKASEITTILTGAPFIRDLVQLLNSILMNLLEKDPHKVMDRLLDGLAYGVAFDWVFLHITKTFPFQLIPLLMDLGVRGTAQILERPDAMETEGVVDQDHFMLISDLLLFLSSFKTPKLRSSLLDQLEAFFSDNQHVAHFVFASRLFIKHSEVFGLVGGLVERFVNEPNMIRVLKLVDDPFWKSVVPAGADIKRSVKGMLKKTSLNGLVLLYECLIPFSFDKEYVKEALQLKDSEVDGKIGLFSTLSMDVYSIIIHELMYSKNLDIKNIARLNEIREEVGLQDMFIRRILEGGEGSEHYCRLLGAVCIKSDKSFSVKVLSKMLYSSRNEDEVWNVCAFNRCLTTHHPLVLTDALRCIIMHPEQFEHTYESDANLIRHLSMLARVQDQAFRQEEGLLAMGLQFGFIDGKLQCYLLDILNSNIAEVTDEDFDQFLDFFSTYLKGLQYLKPVDCRRLPVSTLKGITERLATITTTIIKLFSRKLGKEKAMSELKLFLALARDFLHNEELFNIKKKETREMVEFADVPEKTVQDFDAEFRVELAELEQWFTEAFLKYFLENVFDASHDLFGTVKGLLESPEACAYVDTPENLFPLECLESSVTPSEITLLEKLRAKPLQTKRTAELAHSGVISSAHSKPKPRKWTEVEEKRKEMVLFVVINIIDKKENVDREKLINGAAQVLTGLLCTESLVDWTGWCRWEMEREFVPIYNDVAKRLEASPIAFNLMIYFAEAGSQVTMFNCMPLWKSFLSVTINQLGSTPRRNDPLSEKSLGDLARVFSLLLLSKIVDSKYRSLYEIIRTLGHYDAYTVLVAFWEVLSNLVPKDGKVLRSLETGEKTLKEVLPKLDEGAFYKVLVPIAHQNYSENAEYIADLLDGFEEEDEEW